MFKPMLAGKLDAPFVLEPHRFPVLVSPKLDGIRATVQGGVVLSRSLKPIPNAHVQALLGKPELEGLDGELIVGNPASADAFRTSHQCGDVTGRQAEFRVPCVRQVHAGSRFQSPEGRRRRWWTLFGQPYVQMVPHNLIEDQSTLLKLEAISVDCGYEGLMLRSPAGLYKQGRSTAREGWLLKLKRFTDGEGEVIDLIEQSANTNTAFVDELGHTKRSSHQAGKVAKGTLGAYVVRNLETGVVHKVSPTGTLAERQAIWNSDNVIGKILKFKFFATGGKDKPRFPQALGFRDAADMGA